MDRIDEKKYGRLLAKHLPQVIESDEEQDRLAEIPLQDNDRIHGVARLGGEWGKWHKN